ncbi:hypothetical protein COCVIDRAFT_111168 [Bipolaris victoriae FI3]|nr:hypothetical protein COCVIDRAFT_111168 [Bipolaris victoriae FI3]
MAAAALAITLFDLQGGIYIPPVDPAMVVATVCQKAVSRLKRHFPQLFALSNPGPCNLPLEIILMIAEYLDKCALISLASTIPYYMERLECKKRIDLYLSFLLSCDIPYHHVRLVMNRHFYGPEHGLPLQALSKRRNYTTLKHRIKCSVSRHACIFNDELLILTALSMTQLRGDLVSLKSHVEFSGGSICEHLTFLQESPACIPIPFPELAKKGSTSGPFPACEPIYGSCTSCPTDYNITMNWQGVKKGYSIEVLVYRGLGDCRTPENWYWRNTMARWDPSEQSRSAYSPHNPPGSIRDKWNEAGGVAEITDGAWRRALQVAGL